MSISWELPRVLGWALVTDPLGRIWSLPVDDDGTPEMIGRDSFEAGEAHLSIPLNRGFYVYAQRDSSGSVLYVGSTTYPLGRVANHIAGRNSKSPWFGSVAAIEWICCSSNREMRYLESALIRHLTPPHNKLDNPAKPEKSDRDAPAPFEECDRDALLSLHRRSPEHLQSALSCVSLAATLLPLAESKEES